MLHCPVWEFVQILLAPIYNILLKNIKNKQTTTHHPTPTPTPTKKKKKAAVKREAQFLCKNLPGINHNNVD